MPLDPAIAALTGQKPNLLTQAEADALDAKKRDAGKTPPTKVVVELKLELGEGNEDAIYVVSHRAVADRLREAVAVQRTSRLRGT